MLANKIIKAIKSREFFAPTYDYIHRHTVARLIAFPALKPNQATPPNRPKGPQGHRGKGLGKWQVKEPDEFRRWQLQMRIQMQLQLAICHLPLAAWRGNEISGACFKLNDLDLKIN